MKLFERFFGQKNDEPTQAEPTHAVEGSPTSTPKEVELIEREVDNIGHLLGGNTGNAQFIKLKDDGGAVFKPHSGMGEKDARVFIGRERAAYLINLFLGLDLVPPTVIRKIDDQLGMLQEFVADSKTREEFNQSEVAMLDGELRVDVEKLQIFDFLIQNTDRNWNNLLLKNGKLYAIDHGNALREYNALDGWLPETLIGKTFNLETIERIKQFTSSEEQKSILEQLLHEVLDHEAASKYLNRIEAFANAILENGQISQSEFQRKLTAYE